MGRGVWAGATALFIVACGGAGGGRATTSAGGGQPGLPSAPASPDDGGTSTIPDAGAADPGSTNPDAGPGDAGTPFADAGTGGGGSADGGSGADGGVVSCRPTPEPAVASCDELLPSQPLAAPRRFVGPALSSPDDPVCGPGSFDGDRDGFIGVMRTLAEDRNRRVSQLELDLLTPDGQILRSASQSTTSFFLTVPLPRGAGVVRFDAEAEGTLLRIDGTGTLAEQPVGMARSATGVPGGGTVVAEGGTLYTMDGRKLSAPLRITRRDDTGMTLWSTPIPASVAPEPAGAQVYSNGAGHVLAVVAPDAFQARIVWLDEQGSIVGTGDTLGVFSSRASIAVSLELPDHSLAFGISPAHSSGGWVVVHDLDPHLDVPPCWLDQRRETRIFPIRGGRGYGVFHGTTFAGNEPRHGLEIVTSNGESCGWVDATCGDPTPGACDLSQASIGLDGTLYRDGTSQGDPRQCLVESWPGLLR